MSSRQQSHLQTYTRQAKFPALKTLEEFDFTAIPALPKAKILGLAEGKFIQGRENVVCMGASGTGKTGIKSIEWTPQNGEYISSNILTLDLLSLL
ncbi:hypothetical protein N007_06365 [Alicyclobacillus acidoterrestris ATCC 49025]|nr:hypothetical protein N007_06365 [Alicyclobacillus acidoterrestris ATCC 49025]